MKFAQIARSRKHPIGRTKKTGEKDAEHGEIKAERFGDLVTADHIILGPETDFSRHGDAAALGCQGFITKWIGAYPAPRKTADESMRALQHFAGQEKGFFALHRWFG